ncbi:MAG: hypothetical protein QOG85_772, partial [Gaiellaceae bacterium]|nr:hypothetical protein [Gaiellaceae bacterium]
MLFGVFQRTLGKSSIVALMLLLAVGAASGSSLVRHRSGHAVNARNATSSTRLLSRASGGVSGASGVVGVSDLSARTVARTFASTGSWFFGSRLGAGFGSAAPLAPVTGCGAQGTLADKSGFEDADGNLVINTAGCMDWNGFAPVTWTGTAPYQNATKTTGNFTFFGVSDAFNSSTDTSYAGGIKQADECPATGTGSVDNKTDIARIYVAASTDPVTHHVYLDLAWVRAPQNTTTSDVHIGFEFNQNKVSCGAGSAFVHRTAGDILLVYNFQSGSASIAYSQWTGSAWTPEVTLSSSIAEAQVFGGTTTVDAIKPANGINPATDEFGEAGIDLTAATASLSNDGRACEHFGTAFGESRTSGSSTSAQMKDYAGPANIDISNCVTPGLTTTQLPASGSVSDTFKDKATLSGGVDYDGTGSITFKLYSAADCGGSVLDTETVTGINANGDYTTPNGIQLNSAGTYYWVASFSGDGTNNAKSTGCNDEPVVVNPASIHILKTADAAQVSAGDEIGFTLTVYNTGAGDAYGVNLSDVLPTNAGLSWQIASQGAGWGGTCAITAGTLTCGPKTVAAGTTQAASTFTVHITSTTTAATGGVCPGGSGVVNNTGNVSTTNDGSDQSNASTCVAAPSIHIVKTADAAQVSAGDQIGFTLTVYNNGSGDAKGVTLTDVLPTNPGLSWQIASQGAGWGGTCAITAGTLTCGPKTVAAGTTQAASTFTVHITSTTTAATAGNCPTTGVVDNTGSVSTTNDGSDQSNASTCVAAPVIHIVKTADAAQVNAGEQIGFTLTVYNTGTGDAKGVTLTDVLPTNAGLSWQIASQGAGWGGSCSITAGTLSCGPVTVPFGTTLVGSSFTVHITSTTTAATGGVCPGGSGVVNNTGHVSTTNDGSDQSNASTCVAAPSIHIVKTADAAQVNAGEQIGFTLTVYNNGSGDAKGVTLSDVLPTNAGLSWQIASQGAGWGGSCSITAGTLNCGPVTVPAGTTQAASTFTVHLTSTTTAATGGVCPGGSGVVNNTGHVSTTNDGSDQSNASTCVAAPSIHIVKTADAAQVNAGEQIGFTLTVYNNGSGDATGVTLSDPLPTNAGLSWQIASQGAGWAGSCSITAGTLNCGPVTVPAGTTQAASTFTVHITSTTTAATGGVCPSGSGVVDNTGFVTTTNSGSDQSNASTCVAAPSIHIVKTADAAQVNAGEQIGFTLTVYNNGSGDATGVTLSDVLPTNAGLSWQIASQGAGWGGSCAITAGTLNCGPVTVPAGTTLAGSSFTVHITSTTTAATGGVCPGGSGVVNNTGHVSTTNDGSDDSNASTCVAGPAIHIVKTADAAQVNAGEQIGFT